MQIVIPMSGLGSRFVKAGYTDIKPLIKVDGKPIIEYVVNLFPGETNFLFICNADHLQNTPLRAELERIMPSGTIVGVEPAKKGPVWATLSAQDHIQDDEPVIVNYCDFFALWDYAAFKAMTEATHCTGAIPCYIGFHPHLLGPNFYASCKTDAEKNLIEIREKYSWTENKMESYQSDGTYYFQSGRLVKKYFRQLMNEDINLNGEYYVSLVYNLLVRDQLPVKISTIDKFCQWGTPEDLNEFNNWFKYFKDKGPVLDTPTYRYWQEYFNSIASA